MPRQMGCRARDRRRNGRGVQRPPHIKRQHLGMRHPQQPPLSHLLLQLRTAGPYLRPPPNRPTRRSSSRTTLPHPPDFLIHEGRDRQSRANTVGFRYVERGRLTVRDSKARFSDIGFPPAPRKDGTDDVHPTVSPYWSRWSARARTGLSPTVPRMRSRIQGKQ